MIEGPVVGVGGRRKVGRMEYGEIRGFYVYKLQVLRTGTMDPPAMAIGPTRGYVIKKKKKKKKKKAVLDEVIGHFIDGYQLPDFLREALYQQTPNIQIEFVDSWAAKGFPETTNEQFNQQLEYYINKVSDRYRTQASTTSKDPRQLSKAIKLAG